ncbi:MAG: ParA family protein [Dokdonella sp.]|uniref:ParA family protein n=1 Tax=Dokdonella sp. TaxID=2291710 RepID=UPI0025C42711|nr:ParA family protein [Dokdonella sp.]MBX3700111.1 ParA family protein [Dokdonella sp.]MCW5577558.1 ParA family protein [Dokdonella sp.]
MLKVLVASSKGGAGKSTIATNLAAHYAVGGKNTVLVDADRQGSSLHWSERRALQADPVLGIAGLRRDWARQVPADAECVVIDTPAGIRASEVAEWLEYADVLLVPILPSAIDLEATAPFLAEVADLARVRKGKAAVGLIANRLKPWTNASQAAVEEMQGLSFPLVAQLRDTQGYVLANALGKSIFDYHSEQVRSHQEDWSRLLRWLRKSA